MAMLRSPMGLLLGLSIIWGSSWIANSMLPEEEAPLRIASIRYLFAVTFLALAYGLQRVLQRRRPSALGKYFPAQVPRRSASADSQDTSRARSLTPVAALEGRWIRSSILLGLTMFALPELLLAGAAYHNAAGWTPLLYAALPLGLLLAAGELHSSAILGLGAMLVLLNGSLPLSGAKPLWALLIAGAVATQGWALLYARRHLAIASSLPGVMVQLTTAFCVTTVSAQLWYGASSQVRYRDWAASSWTALSFLAILGTAVAYPVYYHLLRRLEAAQLAVSAWLQTVVAVGESAWLLRQQPGWMMSVAACVLVACAVWLVRRSNPGHVQHSRLLS